MKQLLNLSQPLRSLYCLWYDTITNEGTLNEKANPWAKQLWEDIARLCEMENAHGLWDEAGGDIRRFFLPGDVRDRFLGIDAEAGASSYAGGAPRDGGPAVARLVLLSEADGYPRVGWQFWRDGRRLTQWYDARLTSGNGNGGGGGSRVQFNTLMWSVLEHAPPEVAKARLLLLAMPFAENINYHFGRSSAARWLAKLRDEQLRWCRIEERCEARGREGCDLFSRRGDDSACTHGTKDPDG